MGDKPAENNSESQDFSFLNGNHAPVLSDIHGTASFPELNSQNNLPACNAEFPRSPRAAATPERSGGPTHISPPENNEARIDTLPKYTWLNSRPTWLPGYAIAVTAILLYLALSGRIQLSGMHPLESLPDVRPLAPNEFQKIPQSAALPANHQLKLGESRRFGDVLVTPVKVTVEPLEFEQFQSGLPEPSLRTPPVLKLWLLFRNVADNYAFPPIDAALLSHRSPAHSTDPTTLANSFLLVNKTQPNPIRLLNFLQDPDSNFLLTGQTTGQVLQPGQELLTWVPSASLPDPFLPSDNYTWRIQFRKGVHTNSGHGVTALVECNFNALQIESASFTNP